MVAELRQVPDVLTLELGLREGKQRLLCQVEGEADVSVGVGGGLDGVAVDEVLVLVA